MSVKSFAEAVKEHVTQYTRQFGIEQAEVEEAEFAPLASPALTGTPTVPEAAEGSETTQIASTSFVARAVSKDSGAVSSVFGRTGAVVAKSGDYTVAEVTGVAPLASPALTGTPTIEGKVIRGSQLAIRTPEEFGAKREAGHDDAPAITEAINKVVEEGIANGTYCGEVLFQSGVYNLERYPVQGGTTQGNAQIPLPLLPSTEDKFVLILRGIEDATAGPHYYQKVPYGAGVVLDSQLATSHKSEEWGAASVIGGPTKWIDPAGTANQSFSNMLLVTVGICVRQQKNPPVIGIDGRQLAQFNMYRCSTMVRATPEEMVAELPNNLPTNPLGIGVYFPLTHNNADNNIDFYSSYGHYYGLIAAEHLVASRIITVYGGVGIGLVGFAPDDGENEAIAVPQHGGFIGYYSTEGMSVAHLQAVGGAGCKYPLTISNMACEFGLGTYDILDPGNMLYGEIQYENTYGTPGPSHNARIEGGANLRVINMLQGIGAIDEGYEPTAAELEAGLLNPYQVNAAVSVVNAEVVEIDGVPQLIPASGVATTVFLPANKKIKVKKVSGKTVSSRWVLL